jgi:short-subunit dehydrogenase
MHGRRLTVVPGSAVNLTRMTERPTAVVTGASSGIGEAFARLLAARNHDLVLVARRQDRLDQLAKELDATYGAQAEVIVADLSAPDGLTTVEERVADDNHPIEILVNNAGLGTEGTFASMDIAREEAMIQLNVVAVVRLTHAALGGMLARGHGGIINVSSTAGFQPIPGWSTYAATKAFVSRFTEGVAGECANTGVTVTALCPGFTRTEFQQKADFGENNVPRFLWQTPEEVALAGFHALERKKVYAVPGLAYRALELTTGLLPKTMIRKAATLRYRLM